MSNPERTGYPGGAARSVYVNCLGHGNDEPLSDRVYRALQERSNQGTLEPNITFSMGNPYAYFNGKRFVLHNPYTLFSTADATSPDLEMQSTARVRATAAQHSTVFDIHDLGLNATGSSEIPLAAIIHPQASLRTVAIAAALGKGIVVAATPGMLAGVNKSCIMTELNPHNPHHVQEVLTAIDHVAKGGAYPLTPPYWYRFAGGVTLQLAEEAGFMQAQPFTPLPEHIIQSMGLLPGSMTLGWCESPKLHSDGVHYMGEAMEPRGKGLWAPERHT